MNFSRFNLVARREAAAAVAKERGISFLAARSLVMRAESVPSELKAKATGIPAEEFEKDGLYVVAAAHAEMPVKQLGDGTFIQKIVAIFSDPAFQSNVMKFFQFIMTIIALFPKEAPRLLTAIVGALPADVDIAKFTAAFVEFTQLQGAKDDADKLTAVAIADEEAATASVTAMQAKSDELMKLKIADIAYLTALLNGDNSAVDPIAPATSGASS